MRSNSYSILAKLLTRDTPNLHHHYFPSPMLRTDEILSTIQMLHAEHLDVRSVTLGLNLDDCAAPNWIISAGKCGRRSFHAPAGWSRYAIAWGPSTAFP